MRRGGLVTLLTLTLGSGGFASVARADDTKMECINASERAQQLRDQQRLIDARKALLVCGRPACPAAIRKDCADLLADVDRRMPSIVLRAKGVRGEDVVDFNVAIDDRPIVRPVDGGPINLDPGVHRLRFEMMGATPVRESVTIVQAEHERLIEIDFATPSSDAATGSGQRVAGIVVAALGLGGFVLGAAFGGEAIGDKNTQLADCPTLTQCPDRSGAAAAHADALTTGAVSTVAFIAGALALTTGLILYVTAPHAKGSAWRIGLRGLGIVVGGTFQ